MVKYIEQRKESLIINTPLKWWVLCQHLQLLDAVSHGYYIFAGQCYSVFVLMCNFLASGYIQLAQEGIPVNVRFTYGDKVDICDKAELFKGYPGSTPYVCCYALLATLN